MMYTGMLPDSVREDIALAGDTQLINNGEFAIFEQDIATFGKNPKAYFLFVFKRESPTPHKPFIRRVMASDQDFEAEYNQLLDKGFVRYDHDVQNPPDWIKYNFMVKYQILSV